MSARNVRKEAAVATKVVMRCLPPTLQREAFLEQVSPLPNYDYLHFAPADLSLGSYAYATAYVNFLCIDDVITFKEKFDGYVFLDTKGNEYTAVVEFAPYQKVPKKKSKRIDEKKGTLENDSDYKKFLGVFQSETKVLNVDMAVMLEEVENREKELKASVNQKGSTPLLEFLKKRREERILALQKSKDEKRKKELERKQREEELRAIRKRNEMAKLRQQQLEKKHAEERQAAARSAKAADAEHKPSSASSKSVAKRSSYNDDYYEQEKSSASNNSKRGDVDKVRPEKGEFSDKKPQDRSQKSEVDQPPPKSKSSSSKSDNTYSSKGGDKGGSYGGKDEKSASSRSRHKDVAYDEYGYEYDPNYDYDYYGSYRSYGPSQSDRNYDSSYYSSGRRSQEWSSSRSDYNRPPSKSASNSKHHAAEKEKKSVAPSKQQDAHSLENAKTEDRREASLKEPVPAKNPPAKSSEKPPKDERRDYAHDRDHDDHRPPPSSRSSEQRSAADRERDRQQKVRYRDRPEKEIYVPKRAAERRKQTQPTSVSERSGGGDDTSHGNDAPYDDVQ